MVIGLESAESHIAVAIGVWDFNVSDKMFRINITWIILTEWPHLTNPLTGYPSFFNRYHIMANTVQQISRTNAMA